jgi:hypothetical protein
VNSRDLLRSRAGLELRLTGLNGKEDVCGDEGAERLGMSKYPKTLCGSYDELRAIGLGDAGRIGTGAGG